MTVENNVVRYFKNGGIFYTSATPATSALRLHAVLFNMNAAVSRNRAGRDDIRHDGSDDHDPTDDANDDHDNAREDDQAALGGRRRR